MRQFIKEFYFSLLLIFPVLLFTTPSLYADISYEVINLEAITGVEIKAMDLNNSGQIAGYTIESNGNQAITWSRTNGLQYLGNFGGNSYAISINDHGQIVGYSYNSAFIWDNSNGFRSLGSTGDWLGSAAISINNNGEVVGHLYDKHNQLGSVPFLWDSIDGFQELGTLGGSYGYAQSINDLGQVVGSSSANGSTHTFYWDKTTGMQPIEKIIGVNVSSLKMNNAGQIAFNLDSVYLWDPEDGIRDLFTLGNTSSVSGINDLGTVVFGRYDTGIILPTDEYLTHGFVWNEEQGIIDINNYINQELNIVIPM